MSVVHFNVNTHNYEQQNSERAKQLALALFSNENFLLLAINNFRSQDKKLPNLSITTSKAILAIASTLPPPQSLWQEFAESLEYPMKTRLEEIKKLEYELLQASGEIPLNSVLQKNIEGELQSKKTELHDHVLNKEALKNKLFEITSKSFQNVNTQKEMQAALSTIEQSKKRAKKYTRIQSFAEEALDIAAWIGNGPFPLNPLGQMLAPFPLMLARAAFTLSNRNNPSKRTAQLSQKLDTVSVVAGVGGVIATLVATVSMPLLPVIAAGAILINNLSSTISAYRKYKASKTIIQSPEGKKIRRKGHVSNILGNIAGTIGSTGALGIAIAVTLSISTIAFPPATLAILATVGLGVAIAGMTLSAVAYFRKKNLLAKADNQKILFDFKNACEQGVLNDTSFSFDDKKIRSIALKNPESEPILLLARGSFDSGKIEEADEKNIVKQFERVLALGFIPNLIDAYEKPLSLRPKTYIIQIPKSEPPSRIKAREAILKIGGIPRDHTKLEENLQAHPQPLSDEHTPNSVLFHQLSPTIKNPDVQPASSGQKATLPALSSTTTHHSNPIKP